MIRKLVSIKGEWEITCTSTNKNSYDSLRSPRTTSKRQVFHFLNCLFYLCICWYLAHMSITASPRKRTTKYKPHSWKGCGKGLVTQFNFGGPNHVSLDWNGRNLCHQILYTGSPRLVCLQDLGKGVNQGARKMEVPRGVQASWGQRPTQLSDHAIY